MTSLKTLWPLAVCVACGSQPDAVSSRLQIFGGTPASEPLHSLVRLTYPDNGKVSAYCTGVLINRNQVLTAAHCVTPNKLLDRIGVVAAGMSIDEGIQPDSVSLPQGFQSPPHFLRKETLDLAILSFQAELPETAEAMPLLSTYPDTDQADELLKAQSQGFLGDSAKSLLRIYGFSASSAGSLQGPLYESPVLFRSFLPPEGDELHVGSFEHHSCRGDSGGPLVLWLNQKAYLAGILSRGFTFDAADGCGDFDGNIYAWTMHPHMRGFLSEASSNGKS